MAAPITWKGNNSGCTTSESASCAPQGKCPLSAWGRRPVNHDDLRTAAGIEILNVCRIPDGRQLLLQTVAQHPWRGSELLVRP